MTKARDICVEEEVEDNDQDVIGVIRQMKISSPVQQRVPDDAVFSHHQFRNIPSSCEEVLPTFHPRCDIRRVDVDASPVLAVTVGGYVLYCTLDSGAEASIMEEEECLRLGLEILPTRHHATQGDGRTPLVTVGEVHFTAMCGHHTLFFSGLVAKNCENKVLAGSAFHRINRLAIDYGRSHIVIDNCCRINYDPKKKGRSSTVRALKVSRQTCILPGEFIAFQLPEELSTTDPVAIEPRTTVPRDMPDWIQCDIITPEADGSISVRNHTSSPVLLSKHTQVCQVRPTVEINQEQAKVMGSTQAPMHKPATMSSEFDPSIDTSSISKPQRDIFDRLHKEYRSVFSPGTGHYNGYSGEFSHVVNMNKHLPPQRKCRVPNYSKGDKDKLQEKFDQLREEGVLSRAEEVKQPVEYVHPSFLVKKASGGHRLVTSFGEMADYARPQPTVNTNIEHALYQISQYDEIIVTDMTSSYYQLDLNPESSRFVGVISPYTGTYVYRRSVMGLPGSEAALEELLSRIFGDLIRDGKMVKVADDLFMGAKDAEALSGIWREVLRRLQLNGLKISPSKTKVCPASVTVLGWEWRKGSIQPGQHRINALIACEPPTTVKGLRGYNGCYKYISRVLPRYAEVIHPLEEACAGKESPDKISWTDELRTVFKKSQKHLEKAKPVIIPRRSEQLNIVTDASATGLAATLFVVRDNKLVLAGYFSAALKQNQFKLLPCELEALSIAVSIKHYAYYIGQSTVTTRILTDSKPCVQAFKKLNVASSVQVQN